MHIEDREMTRSEYEVSMSEQRTRGNKQECVIGELECRENTEK